MHMHSEHEIFWDVQGLVRVVANDRAYVVPPGGALLVPAYVAHELHIESDTRLRCTLLSAAGPTRWDRVQPVSMPKVVAEIVMFLDAGDVSADMRRRLEDVVLELIAASHATSIPLPLPRDQRLLRVTQMVCAVPGDLRSVEAWSDAAAMSLRNFTRRFREETGMSFAGWQALARMQLATALLRDGQSLAQVSLRVGYRNISAFSSAFRRVTGESPSSHCRGQDWPDGDGVWPQYCVAAE
ncbi:AraC family transcriptional regulator [Devosia sp. 2618]|uniref:helix-turn-helix transcriptional regulator n=1 Tax=Devosia sp. 2618 TaxID=3156454 RepID=UPI0033940A0A